MAYLNYTTACDIFLNSKKHSTNTNALQLEKLM